MEQKMSNHLSLSRWNPIRYILFDGAMIASIMIVPAIAHLMPFPLYYLEPMRLMIILAIVHTARQNGYLLAFILPFCSWLFSGHPELIKMLIITVELVANIYLFYWLNNRYNKPFAAMLTAILASKILCYFLYWIVFSSAFLASETGMTFLMVQMLVSVIFALYSLLLNRKAR